jgi:hypothetical protein
MSIVNVLSVIQQMEIDGIIARWAVGGAVGATFYLQPVSTVDIDVFVALQSEPGRLLLSLQPIFDYLTARGGVIKGEYIVIADWPVQFLPPTSPLVEEALTEAVTMDVEGLPARVFTAEHLAAVALQTGRAKDKARLLQFIESDIMDLTRFLAILTRHALLDRWSAFKQTFLTNA